MLFRGELTNMDNCTFCTSTIWLEVIKITFHTHTPIYIGRKTFISKDTFLCFSKPKSRIKTYQHPQLMYIFGEVHEKLI